MTGDLENLAGLIDHTLLRPDATRGDVETACEEARAHGFFGVCVHAWLVEHAAAGLAGSGSVAIAVVGFPLGASLTSAKAFEAREAIRAGAREIDMVQNLGALKARDHGYVLADIRAVVEVAGALPVKVILETAQLDRDEMIMAASLAKAAGAAFVKTSTGFGGGGATVEDVALLRSVVGADLGVKASGGIRSPEKARSMLAAGATRLGTSASVAILKAERLEGLSDGDEAY